MGLNVIFATLVLGVLLLAMGSSDACRLLGEGCSAHIGCCGGMSCMSPDGMWGFCQQNRGKRQSDDHDGSGTTHTAAEGDTLFNFGMKYGKDLRQVAHNNNIVRP